MHSAAMVGRSRESGAPIYVRWITAIWQGKVQRVIAELAVRSAELGSLVLTLEKLDVRAGLIARLGRLAAQSEGFVVALKPGHSGVTVHSPYR